MLFSWWGGEVDSPATAGAAGLNASVYKYVVPATIADRTTQPTTT